MALPVLAAGEGLRGDTDPESAQAASSPQEAQAEGAGETTERSGLSLAVKKDEQEEEEWQ